MITPLSTSGGGNEILFVIEDKTTADSGAADSSLATPLSYAKRALAQSEWGQDARRLFHGRGGVLSGWKHVAVDWYAPAVLVTLYQADERNDALLDELGAWAEGEDQVRCFAVQRRYLEKSPVEVVWGELPDQAEEDGLVFCLSLAQNQNHGFFPDMRSGREWVRANADGKRVLNLFSYTCAISVAAIAGGADEVVNLDLSSPALSVGRENHRRNFDQEICRKVRYLPHDLFKSWGRIKRHGPYDMVVLDPPSHQPGSFMAVKDYARMVRRLPEVIHPSGADILACLNAPELGEDFVHDLMAEFLPEAKCVMCLPDSPGYLESGEGWGLKRFVYRVPGEK